jgi:hypothetical protein
VAAENELNLSSQVAPPLMQSRGHVSIRRLSVLALPHEFCDTHEVKLMSSAGFVEQNEQAVASQPG